MELKSHKAVRRCKNKARRQRVNGEGEKKEKLPHPLQDGVLLLLLEVLLLDFEGLVQQLQLGGVCLQVHLRPLLIGLPGEHWNTAHGQAVNQGYHAHTAGLGLTSYYWLET